MGGRLGTCLLETGAITEYALLSVLSEQLGVPVATRADLEAVPQELISLLSSESAINCSAIPFRGSSHHIDVALGESRDLRSIEALDVEGQGVGVVGSDEACS